MTTGECRTIGEKMAAFFRDESAGEYVDLVRAEGASAGWRSRYRAKRVVFPAAAAGKSPSPFASGLNRNARLLADASLGVERKLVELSSGDVAEIFMAGTGPTLVLMHPFNIGAGVFREQFKHLQADFRVVVVHHPGVGDTRTKFKLNVLRMAQFLKDVLDELGIDGPVHIGGLSVGGLVAEAFALLYPEATKSLSLICSSYKVGNRKNISSLTDVLKEEFEVLESGGVLDRLSLDWDECSRILLEAESMDPETGLRYLDEFALDPGLLPRLRELEMPVQVIQGAHDTVISPEVTKELCEKMPDADYQPIVDGGHFPNLTNAREFNALLASFIRGVEGDERSDERSRGRTVNDPRRAARLDLAGATV
jgi:pimeloyl-ACP methyl ester carboxylesterase